MSDKIRKFDTKVQHLKYKVLREVARQAWSNTLQETVLDIPKMTARIHVLGGSHNE